MGKKGRTFLDRIARKLDPPSKAILEDNLAVIDSLSERIESAEEQIDEFIEAHPDLKKQIALLDTIPGVATCSAFLISVEIGDINRFPSPKHLSSSAGIVPSTYQSDERTRHGRITKEGSPWLRWIAIEVAIHAKKHSPKLAHFYQCTRRRHGKKTARVALARKLLTIIYYMLTRQEPYQERTKGPSG